MTMDDIRVRTSEIRMTYEYIRVTYGWHTRTYEWHTGTCKWHTDDIRVHTSDKRMTYEYIRVTYASHTGTCEWHADDMRFERKVKLTFLNFLIILFQNIRFVKEFLACNGCFGLFTKIKNGSGISFWGIFCMVFSYKCSFSNATSVDKFAMSYLFSFSRYQIKWFIKFLFRQLMTS